MIARAENTCPRCGEHEHELKHRNATLTLHHDPPIAALHRAGLDPLDETYLTVLCTTCHAEVEPETQRRARPTRA